MTSNELILQFLDGSLSGDEEAEFLHRLSVSPERRELLRSFMRQSELFARDKNAITVPYAAEQKLWARLGGVIPVVGTADVAEPIAASLAEPIAEAVAATSLWQRVATPVVGVIAALVLTLGIGIGYTVGNNGTSVVRTVTRWTERPQALAEASFQPTQLQSKIEATQIEATQIGAGQIGAGQIRDSRSTQPTYAQLQAAALPVFQLGSANGMRDLSAMLTAYMNTPTDAHSVIASADIVSANENSAQSSTRSIGYVAQRSLVSHYAVGGEATNPFHLYAETSEAPVKTLLQRFEFSFLEGFGRELPSSYANNVSMPILTDAAASVFFQVLPNSEALWVGVSGGAANFSRKHLTTQAGDPGDPLQQQMVAVYAHTPANWAGAFLQYRLPLFTQTDLMMTGGYGLSSAGTLAMGELGLRYDATRDVGFTFGLRGVQLSYNLASEEAATMKAVRGPLVVPNSVANSTPSYNLEINTGLFFHF